MITNWRDISYLASGTPSQRRVHQCLSRLDLLSEPGA
jgi:hypothetical protein